MNPAEEALSSPTLNISISKSRLGEEQKILHVLNRFGYGPRAGDVERIKKMGLVSYLRQQLSPGTIPDLYVERQLRDLPTLAMTTSQLLQDYESGKSLFRKSFHFYHPGAFLPGFFPSSDSVLVGVGSLFWVWGLAASKAVQTVIPNVIRYRISVVLTTRSNPKYSRQVMYFTVECKSLEKRANQYVE